MREYREKIDQLIEAVKADPFKFNVGIVYGDAPLEKLKQLTQNSGRARIEEAEEVLEDLEAHLDAAVEIIQLYETHYAPMTKGGCIDLGAMLKEDFEKKAVVLKDACAESKNLLLSLELRKPKGKPPAPKL